MRANSPRRRRKKNVQWNIDGQLMKLSYDPRSNLAYITFREKIAHVETRRISHELRIDIGADGKLYGIALLNANQQLKPSGGFTLINESTGEVQEIEMGW
jgi:uncharacterized protein YuzE